jgi:rod shape-determining protein MreD
VRLNNQQNFLFTLIAAMGLRIAPFPHFLSILNPDWVLLALIYWTLMQPYQNGVFTAWTVGLFTDVLTGRVLGEYALIYALISYFSIAGHKRLRQYPLIQQSIYIFVCLLIAQLTVFVIESAQSPSRFSAWYWLPVLTGTLAWSFIHTLLRLLRNLRRVS